MKKEELFFWEKRIIETNLKGGLYPDPTHSKILVHNLPWEEKNWKYGPDTNPGSKLDYILITQEELQMEFERFGEVTDTYNSGKGWALYVQEVFAHFNH